MPSRRNDRVFTVADYLLTRLHQLGYTSVFQIFGDYVKHFIQAPEHSREVRMIATSNDPAAAYGRTRGSLQCGVSTYNTLNAFAGAYVEPGPVVIISATPGADARRIGDMYDVRDHHFTGNLDVDQASIKATIVELDDVRCQVREESELPTIVNVVIPEKTLPQQMARIAA